LAAWHRSRCRWAATCAPVTSSAGAQLAELARGIGVDATTLEASVQRFNEHARRGEDPDFGKGSKAYNRYQGDALNQPNPCVAPLETGPFYAIKLVVGDIGTFAGLATDAQTRVLDAQATAPSRGCTRWATTPPASWVATTPVPASRWARR
jgi:predicted oxidoreductase